MQRKKLGRLFTMLDVRQKGKDLEMLCVKMTGNVICLRMQSECAKLSMILLLSRA